jgi:hypothetical protein
MAQELGLPESAVNLYTPQIKNALNKRDDQGNFMPMSLEDFTTQVRQDPRWRKTDTAINSTMAVGHDVLKDMGLVT